MLKPQLKLTWVKTRSKTKSTDIDEEIAVDYAAEAQKVLDNTVRSATAAALLIGAKVLVGSLIVVATHAVLTTGGAILTNALDNRHKTEE